MSRRPANYAGRTIGGVRFLRPAGRKRGRALLWAGVCLTCGREVERVPAQVAGYQSCGCARAANAEAMRRRFAADPALRERQDTAARMRVKGETYRAIGETLGVSRQRAEQMCRAARKT